MAGAGRLLLAWGAVLALMHSCFYLAIDRLPLGTVAAIEFLPVVVLAALGTRTVRNVGALALAVPGVYLLADVALDGNALGVAFRRGPPRRGGRTGAPAIVRWPSYEALGL